MIASAPPKPKINRPYAPVTWKPAWLTRVLVLVLWQVIAILVAELFLFFVGLGEEEIFKFDPELGTKHMTNKRVTWRSEGYAQFYLNDDGMREPGLTIAKPPG